MIWLFDLRNVIILPKEQTDDVTSCTHWHVPGYNRTLSSDELPNRCLQR